MPAKFDVKLPRIITQIYLPFFARVSQVLLKLEVKFVTTQLIINLKKKETNPHPLLVHV